MQILGTHAANADAIFGGIDAMKLRSSLTLFARAAPEQPLFEAMLHRYFGGVFDDATDGALATGGEAGDGRSRHAHPEPSR